MRIRSAGAILWAAVIVCACATSSPRPALEAPPPHARGSVLELGADARAAPTVEATRLDVLPTGEVSLAQVLTWADRHSPLLLVARSTRSRAEAARVGAAILQQANPEVSVAVGPRFGIFGIGVDVEANVSQQLQIAGERGLRLDAARRLRELTDAEIEQIRWAVHGEVHAGFHRVLVARERVRLAEQVVAFQAEVLRVVER